MLAEKLISKRWAKLNGEIAVDTLLHPATPNFPSHSSVVVLTRPVALIPEREIERRKQSPAQVYHN